MTDSPQAPQSSLLWRILPALFMLTLVTASLPGCGDSEKDDQSILDEDQDTQTTPDASLQAANKDGVPNGPWTNPGGQKMLKNVPYDVWYPNPLEVANNQTSIGSVPTASPGNTPSTPQITPTPEVTPTPATPMTTPTGAVDWSTLISQQTLQDEVKALANELRNNLQSVGEYNRTYYDPNNENIRSRGATIAAMASIALKHPADIRWKANAKYLRDLSFQIGNNAEGPGKKFLDKTLLVFEQANEILAGSTPAGLDPNTPEDKTFDEVAERSGLMQRMQSSSSWMKKNVTTENVFKAEKDKIRHEASVLAALSQMILDESYTSADEEEYANEAKGLVQDAKDIIAALEADNFNAYTEAINRVQTRCNNCHAEYRFADDF